MGNVMKNLGSWSVVIIFILVLGAWPVGATVPGDIAAGLPLNSVVANGLGAGMTIGAIIGQALDAGANPEALFKAAIAQGADLSMVAKSFLDRAATDPRAGDIGTTDNMMKWAKEMGKDPVEIANAMMAAGANLDQVKRGLAAMGYVGADTYAYSPPGPPAVPAGVGPSFPGGGGGGGAASPSS